MAKLVLEEGEEREYLTLPADSIVALKVEAVDLSAEKPAKNGGTYRRLEFTFTIQGILSVGNEEPIERYEVLIGSKIFGSTPTYFDMTNANRLRQWTEAILNMQLSVGFELDTDLLVGRRVRGVTKIWTGTKIDPYTKQVKTGHDIAALLPMGQPMTEPVASTGWNPTGASMSAQPAQQPVSALPDPWASQSTGWADVPPPF